MSPPTDHDDVAASVIDFLIECHPTRVAVDEVVGHLAETATRAGIPEPLIQDTLIDLEQVAWFTEPMGSCSPAWRPFAATRSGCSAYSWVLVPAMALGQDIAS